MPFRDREWEDFQRDCDFFPAYTDYIFGVDTRPNVADEPGLHPQIYDRPPLPPQRLRGLPPAGHFPVAYDVAWDAARAPKQPSATTNHGAVTRELQQMFPNSQHTSLLRHESSTESLLPTPTPAPRTLPTPGSPVTLLRPGELTTDGQYSFIPEQERTAVNRNVIQAPAILNSDAVPAQKAKAMGYLKSTSRMVALKKQEWQRYQAAMLEAEIQAEEWELNDGTCEEAEGERTACAAEAMAGQPAISVPAEPEYAIREISELLPYLQSRLSQLWTCIELVGLQAPPTDPAQFSVYLQAQQYMMAFRESVPPNGREWVGKVVDRMIRLHKEGGDPLEVLQTMPGGEYI